VSGEVEDDSVGRGRAHHARPPAGCAGHGDLCKHGGRAGCVDLLDEVESRIRPRYHVFGHIHEGYGATTNGETTFINASTCNYRYDRHNLNPPIVFDVPTKRHHHDQDEDDDVGEEEP